MFNKLKIYILSLLSSNSFFSQHLLCRIENNTKNRTLLFRIANIYRIQKKHEAAFNILFNLILSEKNKDNITPLIIKALQVERDLNEKRLMKLFESKKFIFPEMSTHLLSCEYSLHSENIIPDWLAISSSLKNDFDYTLANFFMLAALGHHKINYIDEIRDILISKKDESLETYFERSLTIVATSYYRCGEARKLQQLDKVFSFNSLSWKLYMAFGHGRILEAMQYRGKAINTTFSRFYPYKKQLTSENILTPEKDICGEAFNSLFYEALYDDIGKYSVICDNRLLSILNHTFPLINFIPKTPRYLQKSLPENFDKLNVYLRDFLDHDSFYRSKGANFINIDYKSLYKQEKTQNGYTNGWLKTDSNLREYWVRVLGKNQHLIGVSAHSTQRSKIRDIHMIGLEHWEKIFSLPNCKFINLNSSLSEESTSYYAEKFNIEFITPDIDLFNDFDNLLAIMSILDFAVVPANNMMDFAASLGINSIVFSPSNIMKTWATSNDNYIFSEKVKFIFPENNDSSMDAMVKKGSQHIKNTLHLN